MDNLQYEIQVAFQRRVLFGVILLLVVLLIALPVGARYLVEPIYPSKTEQLTKAGFKKDEVLIIARACEGEKRCVITTHKGHRVHVQR